MTLISSQLITPNLISTMAQSGEISERTSKGIAFLNFSVRLEASGRLAPLGPRNMVLFLWARSIHWPW
jgi:hypothetical protein